MKKQKPATKNSSSKAGAVNASGTTATIPGNVAHAFETFKRTLEGVRDAGKSAHQSALDLGAELAKVKPMEARKAALTAGWASYCATISGLSDGTLKQYKSLVRKSAKIPASNGGGGRKPRRVRGDGDGERQTAGTEIPAAVDESPLKTHNERISAMVGVLVRAGCKSEADCIGLAKAAWARMPKAS